MSSPFDRIFGRPTWYVYHCLFCGEWGKVLARKPPTHCSSSPRNAYLFSDCREKLNVARIWQYPSKPFLVSSEVIKYDAGIRKIFGVNNPDDLVGLFVDAFPSRFEAAKFSGEEVMVGKGDLVFLSCDYAGRTACPECAKKPEAEATEGSVNDETYRVGYLMVAKVDHLTGIALWVDCSRHSPCCVPYDVESALSALSAVCYGGKPDPRFDPRFDHPPIYHNEELVGLIIKGRAAAV